MSAGQFEVPDTAPHEPPAKVRFKLDGPVPAAARAFGHGPPARRFGRHAIRSGDDARHHERQRHARHADESRSAARLDQLCGRRRCDEFFRRPHDHGPEGRSRRRSRSSPTTRASPSRATSRSAARRRAWNTRKARADSDAEINLQGMLDETARANFGLDPNNTISGAIPVQAHRPRRHRARPRWPLRHRGGSDPGAARRLPARLGQAGRQAGARDVHAHHQAAIDPHRRSLIEGAGGGVKGTVELDGSGESAIGEFSVLRLCRRRPRPA